MPADATSDFLQAFAQGVTGLLAIAFAALVFVAERTVRRARVRDPAYRTNLTIVISVSVTTALLATLAWWTWAEYAPAIDLLFGLCVNFWLAIVFAPIVLGAVGSAVVAVISLVRMGTAGGGSGDWEP